MFSCSVWLYGRRSCILKVQTLKETERLTCPNLSGCFYPNGTTKDSFIPAEANTIHISKLRHQREGQSPFTNSQLSPTHPERSKWKEYLLCHHYDWPMFEFLIMGKNIAKFFILRTIFVYINTTHDGFIASSDLSRECFILITFAIHMSCPFADQCKCCLPLTRAAFLQKPFD